MNTFKTLTSLALLVSTRFALVQAAVYVSSYAILILPWDMV
jgi:hypothetical protein